MDKLNAQDQRWPSTHVRTASCAGRKPSACWRTASGRALIRSSLGSGGGGGSSSVVGGDATLAALLPRGAMVDPIGVTGLKIGRTGLVRQSLPTLTALGTVGVRIK